MLQALLNHYLAGRQPLPTTALMYHSVGESLSGWPWQITTKQLKAQLTWLSKRNSTICSMADYIRLRENKSPHAKSAVILTFDDGYADNLPIAQWLHEYGMSASFFVPAANIGGAATWENTSRHMKLLNDEQIVKLDKLGMEVGVHGWKHSPMNAIAPVGLLLQLQKAKRRLQHLVSQPIIGLAYPYGLYSAKTLETARKAGFAYAFSTESGRLSASQSDYQLKRLTILANDSLADFQSKCLLATNQASTTKLLRYLQTRLVARA